MPTRTTRTLAALALAALCGCSEDVRVLAAGETWRPAHRFAVVGAALDSGSLEATATIGDETRPALRAREPFTLNYSPKYAVPATGKVTLRPPLPEGVSAERLLVEVRVRPADRWLTLPGRLLAPYFARGKQRVDVELDFAAEGHPGAAGRTVGVWVTARVPEHGESVIEGEAVTVPPRARLDFAVGVADVARLQGPVDFVIDACTPTDVGCAPVFETRLDPSREDHRGWQEYSVDLDAVAGRDVSLRFTTRAVGNGGAGEAYSLPFWADPTLLEVTERAAETPNLILLSLDTLRADHMGAYGYARETTPFIDRRLAGGGTLFERYVAAASSTRPSHMTMFTSLPPSVHGATENAGVRTLPPGATTLAELLRDGGFRTAAITENGAIDRSRGFGRGFDVYVENRDSQSADMRTGHVEQTFARGLAWLERHRGERFFLFLHTYQVHNPFTPPPAYASFFTAPAPALEPPPGLRADWDPLLYDREIRYTDDRVRELVASLEALGALENTLLVLTSDHGEAFLEHGFVAHGANVHHEVLNVPLIVVGPGVPAGRRVRAPVPMIDLMPTLLELVGVEPGGREMGRSQAAVVLGGPEPENAGLRAIYGEAWATRAVRARGHEEIPQPTLSLELAGRKLVRARTAGGFRYELYDVQRDPAEEMDLYDDEPETVEELRQMLLRYEERTAALHAALGEARPEEAPDLDPRLEEKLRALGYID